MGYVGDALGEGWLGVGFEALRVLVGHVGCAGKGFWFGGARAVGGGWFEFGVLVGGVGGVGVGLGFGRRFRTEGLRVRSWCFAALGIGFRAWACICIVRGRGCPCTLR